ncbi:hypothetical protein BGW38_000956 [Lunasporangiospora selenospora]|uniref:Uncharacterized protein n=1 Tax=Lunasporangiospora selenospora TaxID=979761 RepID=A0A9P6G3P5_9FUNG|nr:hypothetical protein BGW38_000956 [Lunasporangiospora selenospora]
MSFAAQHSTWTETPHSVSNVVVFDKTIAVDEDVVDFFNARFSSHEDLVKLKEVQRQQQEIGNELRQKLAESRENALRTLTQADATAATSLDKLQELESSAKDLDEQLEHADTFERPRSRRDQRTLIEELADMQKKVRALEDAKRYILIVARAQKLVDESRQELQVSTEKALGLYNSLLELSNKVRETVGGHDTRLEPFLRASVESLLKEIKTFIAKKFQKSLDALGWPTPITEPSTISDENRIEFEKAFKEMLLLQEPIYGPLDKSGSKPFPPLLPIELLAAPIIMRFRFHFDGNKPTNRLDKPEWYFTHVQDLIKDHTPFLHDIAQDVVQDTDYKEYDVKNDFIRVFLGAVERKIRSSVPALLSSPELLSHAIYETLKFDKVLREGEYYVPPGQTSEWPGSVQVYLGNREWLRSWLRIEKNFAVSRYNQIMEEPDAWQPAYGEIDEKEYTIPTKSAEKLIDLLEIVTERYRPLPVLEHRTYLLDIQLDILLEYYQHIRELVDHYESLTYSFVRVMPGAASAEELNAMGINALRSLCQWLASVEYVGSTLKDWAEDAMFLEMYKDFVERPVKARNPLHSENEDSDAESEEKKLDENGTIFDERSWPQIEMASIEDSFGRSESQQYGANTFESSDDVSPELYQSLSVLGHSLEFLATALPTKQFTSLYRQISLEIQDHIWQKVVLKNQFSELGGQQFARDMRVGLWGAAIRKWIKKPENYHRKLRDASILLSLQSARTDSLSPQGLMESGVYVKRTLAQIMAVLFDDGLGSDNIRQKLEEIGVLYLDVAEARNVVRRRVECWR